MQARIVKHTLKFKVPAGTSRGVMLEKPAWILILEQNGVQGIGEISRLPGLSYDDNSTFDDAAETLLDMLNRNVKTDDIFDWLTHYPSLRFALETALLHMQSKGFIYFRNAFTEGTEGIPINGLIWMGEPEIMLKQIDAKLQAGFTCLKLKIGSLQTELELNLMKHIRNTFSAQQLQIRVDANGAFAKDNVFGVLQSLSKLQIHSIEQPVAPRQFNLMADVCRNSPVPVALDEELIGITRTDDMEQLLTLLNPAYLILKPGLLGGFTPCEKWIELCSRKNTGWWITSALESNIGLNAIAQWTSTLNSTMYQGLGTGSLYETNWPLPLEIRGEKLWFNPAGIRVLEVLEC
jgi:o-succinylbenzoate synthase